LRLTRAARFSGTLSQGADHERRQGEVGEQEEDRRSCPLKKRNGSAGKNFKDRDKTGTLALCAEALRTPRLA